MLRTTLEVFSSKNLCQRSFMADCYFELGIGVAGNNNYGLQPARPTRGQIGHFRALRDGEDFKSGAIYDEEAGEGARVGVAEWFTHRKRGLLVPFGIGLRYVIW